VRKPWLWVLLLLAAAPEAWAGPPYVTDDPEPVEYQHMEVYVASQTATSKGLANGTAPHFDINYGIVPDIHLHLNLPLAFSAQDGEATHYGIGDIEIGSKMRFLHETKWLPELAFYPAMDFPTGNATENLGTGSTRAFFPIWAEKTWGKWSATAGGGYWINPGTDQKNWALGGLQGQRKMTEALALGAEIYHTTAQQPGDQGQTAVNVGLIYDFSEIHHWLLSGGTAIQGEPGFQTYLAYQATFALFE
jgi:hypothetical protein